jgi:hypothetical protein
MVTIAWYPRSHAEYVAQRSPHAPRRGSVVRIPFNSVIIQAYKFAHYSHILAIKRGGRGVWPVFMLSSRFPPTEIGIGAESASLFEGERQPTLILDGIVADQIHMLEDGMAIRVKGKEGIFIPVIGYRWREKPNPLVDSEDGDSYASSGEDEPVEAEVPEMDPGL